MEKKNYNKKTSTKSVKEIFYENFPKMDNSKENISKFKEGFIFIQPHISE